jgi:hypothetical protein
MPTANIRAKSRTGVERLFPATETRVVCGVGERPPRGQMVRTNRRATKQQLRLIAAFPGHVRD